MKTIFRIIFSCVLAFTASAQTQLRVNSTTRVLDAASTPVAFPQGGLLLRDTDSTNNLIISNGDNLSADRTLIFNTLGNTSVTFPTSGTLLTSTSVGNVSLTSLTGDVTTSGFGAAVATLASVNSNVGTFGNATQVGQIVVNAKGLITAVTNVTITPAASSISGVLSGAHGGTGIAGTGIATAADLSNNFIMAGWGDSLTAGAGGGSTTYLTRLNALTGFTTYNGGVGGETAPQIAVRMLAAPSRYGQLVILWEGRNGVLTDPSAALTAIASQVSALTTNHYMVLSVINSSTETTGTPERAAIVAFNATLASTYGSHYVDVWTYLLNLVPTGDGTISTTLRSDALHLNATGYSDVGDYIFQNWAVLQGTQTAVMGPGQTYDTFLSPPAIGATTPNAGAFTTITATGTYNAPGIILQPAISTNSPIITLNQISGTARNISLSSDATSFTFNARLIPATDDLYDLGFSTSIQRWRNLYLSQAIVAAGNISGANLNATSGFISATRSSQQSYIYPTSDGTKWQANKSWLPDADATFDLGSGSAPTQRWRNLSLSGNATVAGNVTASNISGTNTGDQTITLTGDVTGTGTGSFATTIGAGKVTLTMNANMATASFLGRATAGSGAPEVLSASSAKTVLAIAQSDVSGLTTASAPTFAGLTATGSLTATTISASTGFFGATRASQTKGFSLTSDGSSWQFGAAVVPDTDNSFNLGFSTSILRWKDINMTGVLNIGSTPTALTDSAGKVLSARLNTVAVANGGTGQTTYTDGQVLIGNTTGNTLAKATLTAGSGISITNGSGSITIATSASVAATEAYGAGTAYTLTATPAAVDFGTTDPSITIATAGTYTISGQVNLFYNAATFAGNQTATLTFRRTNNTPANLTNGTIATTTQVITALTYTYGVVRLPDISYTASAGDVVTIYADISATPGAGSFQAVASGTFIRAKQDF